MEPVQIINAAVIGINALLQVISNLKSQAGLTDEQLAAMLEQHGVATTDAIKGYLASIES